VNSHEEETMMRAWISLLIAASMFGAVGCSKKDDAADAPAPADAPSTMPAPAPDQTAPPASDETTPPSDTTSPPQQEPTSPPQQ
jgi:hypothetical protein